MRLDEQSKNSGFTLTETVIALGIVVVLLTSLLGAFGPATKNIRQAVSVQESGRIIAAVEAFFENPVDERGRAITFDDVVKIIDDSQKTVESDSSTGFSKRAGGGLFVYNYRIGIGDNSNKAFIDSDTEQDLRPGIDYTTVSATRPLSYVNVADFQNELKAIEGRLFYVRFQQLIPEQPSGTESASNTFWKINDTTDLEFGDSSTPRPEDAGVLVAASFFIVPTIDISYLQSKFGGSQEVELGSPVLVRNLGINR